MTLQDFSAISLEFASSGSLTVRRQVVVRPCSIPITDMMLATGAGNVRVHYGSAAVLHATAAAKMGAERVDHPQ